MMGAKGQGTDAERPVADSTRQREAYFLEYAKSVRSAARMPVMVTGGFRSRAAMDEALAAGELEVIGLGRPMCVDTDAPHRLLRREWSEAVSYERRIQPARAGLAWFCLAMLRIGDGLEPDRELDGSAAMAAYADNEARTAQALIGR
jgi:hypothetical protein